MKKCESITSVVADGLCTQCGWCVMACPHHIISQRETPAGYLFPVVDEAKCTHCGVCHRACPGVHNREDGEDVTDPLTGNILAAFCGYATDSAIRERSQSGGITSALLLDRMRSGLTDAALVTRMQRDGSLRPRMTIARTPEDVTDACGSKYCPVRFDDGLTTSLSGCHHITAVGIPCQIRALRNLQRFSTKWRDSCDLTLGLICDRIMTYHAIEQILTKGRMGGGRANYLEYRSKEWLGWPGDIMLESSGGARTYLPAKYRMKLKDVFTPPRCRICHYKQNTLADVSLGDAHGLSRDKRGCSVVYARTPRGLDALQAAQAAGAIVLESVPIKEAMRYQKMDMKQRDWLVYCAAWKALGWRIPEWSEPFEGEGNRTKRSSIRKHTAMLSRAKVIATQTSAQSALSEARRQLFRQQLYECLSWNLLRKSALLKWLRLLVRAIRLRFGVVKSH